MEKYAKELNGKEAVRHQRRAKLSRIGFGLCLALGMVHAVQADIVADRSAAAGQQPGVAYNGDTPVVNITAPSAAGVSRNTYSEFNVYREGVVLNNSLNTTATNLAGNIAANKALNGTAARIILNEVNSANPSQLNGMIEVGGNRAQVIIANPSGISCNGCGFINTSRGVLTTGVAQLDKDGVLTGYKVNEGEVSIGDKGLKEYDNVDYTDIIARTSILRGRVGANDLKITTGRNLVDAKNEKITPLADDYSGKPELAFNATYFGGIDALKIAIISTEDGVGVNNASRIFGDEIDIDVQGNFLNKGHIYSYLDGDNNHLTVTARSVTNQSYAGHLLSYGKLTIKTDELNNIEGAWIDANIGKGVIESKVINNLDDSNILASGGDMKITADTLNNEWRIIADGRATRTNKNGNLTIETKQLNSTAEGVIYGSRSTNVKIIQ